MMQEGIFRSVLLICQLGRSTQSHPMVCWMKNPIANFQELASSWKSLSYLFILFYLFILEIL